MRQQKGASDEVGVRITKEQAQKNHDLVVEVAAERFRERGFDGISIAELMQSAGFTHGGFYNHFDSKDELAVKAAELAFKERSDDLTRAGGVSELLRRYLSRTHSAAVGQGCPAAALGADAARQSDDVRRAFALGIEGMIGDFGAGLPEGLTTAERRALAINLVARCVGALLLSRAVPSTDRLAREVLSSALTGALAEVEAARPAS